MQTGITKDESGRLQVANVLASTAIANGSANAQTVITISSAQDDQDQDTIPDNLEGASDLDADNLPNFLDGDADGDTIQDKDEAGDANGNSIPDFLESSQTPPAIHLYLPIVSR